jgi:glucans biosynthesis protein
MRSFWRAQACRILMVTIAAASLAGAPARAWAPDNSATTNAPASLVEADRIFAEAARRAEALASAPYQPPATDLPAAFAGLDYDGYRKLRPMPDRTVWGEAGNAFGFLPLPRGGLYREAVNIFVVEDGKTLPAADASQFIDFVDFATASEEERNALGHSGWRAIAAPGQAGVGYEAAVFQGATYFRATAESLVYGASARALAIGAGSPGGEEFPRFTDFWIVKPQAGDDTLAFVALSDSPSAAGAWRFVLRPGRETTIEVVAEIHPRVEVSEVGVAPLSSMFLHGAADRGGDDWRSEVHDSDGLLILSASGEWVWRPLTNPKETQLSSFVGNSLRGFGLMQRTRDFDAYGDLEARYERRPDVWIEPIGNWGAGEVRLLEIPSATEYNDNVAVFWRPASSWKPGEARRFSYVTRWGAGAVRADVATVAATRSGAKPDGSGLRHFVIDFAGGDSFAAPLADVWASGGDIRNVLVSDGPSPDTRRLSFDLDPKDAAAVELHAALKDQTSQLTETWLFRWTRE